MSACQRSESGAGARAKNRRRQKKTAMKKHNKRELLNPGKKKTRLEGI